MRDPNPRPGDLSGYISSTLHWMYSVWDPARGWVDVGYDRERADRRSAQIREANANADS